MRGAAQEMKMAVELCTLTVTFCGGLVGAAYIDIYVLSTLGQQRLNNLMLLHVHEECTDLLSVLTRIIIRIYITQLISKWQNLKIHDCVITVPARLHSICVHCELHIS